MKKLKFEEEEIEVDKNTYALAKSIQDLTAQLRRQHG